ncbi:kinase [Planococcus shenhongbingii]|uniref:Kinase n=1 Tax=Planococcus shenhongbingii TaxID=3058398 RepID=A0ABT8NDM8_9BACL|nr:kinase [Planococcus sp. N017]MDN7245986.1 kinase [Planococcus sp. N017]
MKIEYEDFFRNIPLHNFPSKTIIGIDGLSRSGKTTFAGELEKYLIGAGISVQVFHTDDFIVERKRRYGTGLEEWQEYYFLQWEAEHLAEFFFGKLKSANFLELWYYDTEKDSHSLKTIDLPDEGVVLIEGVFLQRKEWRNFFDQVVYLECSAEDRFFREPQDMRNKTDLLKRRYWKAEAYYEETVKPAEQADWLFENAVSKIGDFK